MVEILGKKVSCFNAQAILQNESEIFLKEAIALILVLQKNKSFLSLYMLAHQGTGSFT
jgi:hypothetical protein